MSKHKTAEHLSLRNNVLTIVGSTSLIARSLCDKFSDSSGTKIYLLGRRKPDWVDRRSNVEYIYCDLVKQLNLDEFFSVLHKDANFSGLIYLPSAQFGRRKLTELTSHQINETIQVSLTSAILTVQSYARFAPSSGSIVLFSSQAATFGGQQISAYAAAKGGLESFVKGVARELGPLNIRINALSPGIVYTETLAKNAIDLQQLAATVPLGRLGDGNDVANAIKWLLSAESEYISGAVIALTGGR